MTQPNFVHHAHCDLHRYLAAQGMVMGDLMFVTWAEGWIAPISLSTYGRLYAHTEHELPVMAIGVKWAVHLLAVRETEQGSQSWWCNAYMLFLREGEDPPPRICHTRGTLIEVKELV